MLYPLYWESSLRSATVIQGQTYISGPEPYKQSVDEASNYRGKYGACSDCMVGFKLLELPVGVYQVLPRLAIYPTLLGIGTFFPLQDSRRKGSFQLL
jgi:hypothetical protein